MLRRLAGVLGIGIALLILLGLVLVDYRAALILIGGGAAAFLLMALIRYIRTDPRRHWPLIGIPAAVILCSGLAWLVLSGPLLDGAAAEPPVAEGQGSGEPSEEPDAPSLPVAVVTGYTMIIQPEARAGSFTVTEQAVYEVYLNGQLLAADLPLTIGTRKVDSAGRGFLLWGSEVPPLEGDPSRPLEVSAPDGTLLTTQVCGGSQCAPSTIELRDFPKGAFVAARDAETVETLPFVNTETVIWSQRSLHRPVSFAFIRPPFNSLRPVLGPLLGASTLSDWAIGLIGLLGTVTVLPFARALLEDWFEGKLVDGAKSVAARRRKRTSRKSDSKR
jgi:hypothetical protein